MLARGVRVVLGHAATELRTDGDAVIGVRCTGPSGEPVELSGAVVLTTGAHDWSPELSKRFTGIPEGDGGMRLRR